jgi:phosphoglycerate dehydrogenase-like enzyme
MQRSLLANPTLGRSSNPKNCIDSTFSSAGYARYDTEEIQSALVKRHAIMTKSSPVTVEPCAQHLIAWMLADARQLYLSYENERGSHGWPQNDLREKARLLDNQVVFIVGYGAIGRRLAELLAPYPVRVIGCRRTPRGGFSSDLATLPLVSLPSPEQPPSHLYLP